MRHKLFYREVLDLLELCGFHRKQLHLGELLENPLQYRNSAACTRFKITPQDLQLCASWGLTSSRIMLFRKPIFCNQQRRTASTVSPLRGHLVDVVVAYATTARYDLLRPSHSSCCLVTAGARYRDPVEGERLFGAAGGNEDGAEVD